MLTLAMRQFRGTVASGCVTPVAASSLVTLRFEAEHEGGGNGRSVATLRSVKGSVFKLKISLQVTLG